MSRRSLRSPAAQAWILGLVSLFSCACAAATTQTSRADRLANDGNYAAAAKAFAQLQAESPHDAAITARLARLDLLLGKPEQAVDWAKKSVALAPHSARYQILLGDAYTSYVNDVSIFRKLGVAHKIRDAYQKATQLDPDNADAHFSLTMFYLLAPGIAGGSDDKAAEQIRTLAKLDPGMADLAQARRATKDKQDAKVEGLLRKAAAAAKDDSGYMVLGAYLLSRQRSKQALAVFRQAMTAYPHDPDAYYQVGKLAATGKADPQAGIKALETYLGMSIDWTKGNPPFCRAHYRLAQIWMRLGDRAKARSEYRQSLQLDPGFKQARQALQKLGPG